MGYRHLTADEIGILERNRCRADDWNTVWTEDGAHDPGAGLPGHGTGSAGFTAKRVRFEGEVRLGAGCRVVDSTLADCTVGRGTEIRNVERMENYIVGDGCHIFNSGNIEADEYAAMGCGTTVNVLDETGGRQVVICPDFSAQTAYMMAFYRHDRKLVDALSTLVGSWGREHRARQGIIGDGVTICYVTAIKNVNIGSRSQIRSAVRLENGTLGLETQVLENVSAADFILSDRAVLGTSCVAKHVFLGQAASLNNSFVAHNSLIFSNSVLECGETDALFAGPHTVSYHRSTLLIAAATSFFNAGSGTNQSNHYYCTGPIHHGIFERGCKTGSNSYVKWPARIGQFSVIVGSHGNHPDTSSLPFSYVFGNNGVTTVIPAANIKTCGVMRDVLKWRGRDHRSLDCRRLDCINYEEFTPYNAERMFQGVSLLERLRNGELTPDQLRFRISPGHIDEGIRLYGLGLRYFFGSVLVGRILETPDGAGGISGIISDEADAVDLFPWTSEKDGGTAFTEDLSPWVDMAGMIAPRPVVDELCRQIAAGRFGSLAQVDAAVARIHACYRVYTWIYVRSRLQRVFNIDAEGGLTCETLSEVVRQWGEVALELCRLRTEDAMKDFSPEMSVGFGIDHPEMARADSENSVGCPDDNPHVVAIRNHYALDAKNAALALGRLASI